jgi:hypothetical protein
VAKKKFVPPIKAPDRNIKGIGKMGTFEGGLCPTIIAPKFGPNSGKLNGQILGKQGK